MSGIAVMIIAVVESLRSKTGWVLWSMCARSAVPASILCPLCASCCCCWQGLCKFQAFIRWQTDGQAGGMAWLCGSLKNAYDLCKQFPIRSAPRLPLASPCAPVTWRYAQLGHKYMCICIWIGCIKIFYGLWCKSNFVSWTRDKRSLRMWLPFVLACPFTHGCVRLTPSPSPPSLLPPSKSVCLPSHIFMHFLSGHFYARTRFPLDVKGCHFRSLAELFDFCQWICKGCGYI